MAEVVSCSNAMRAGRVDVWCGMLNVPSGDSVWRFLFGQNMGPEWVRRVGIVENEASRHRGKMVAGAALGAVTFGVLGAVGGAALMGSKKHCARFMVELVNNEVFVIETRDRKEIEKLVAFAGAVAEHWAREARRKHRAEKREARRAARREQRAARRA